MKLKTYIPLLENFENDVDIEQVADDLALKIYNGEKDLIPKFLEAIKQITTNGLMNLAQEAINQYLGGGGMIRRSAPSTSLDEIEGNYFFVAFKYAGYDIIEDERGNELATSDVEIASIEVFPDYHSSNDSSINIMEDPTVRDMVTKLENELTEISHTGLGEEYSHHDSHIRDTERSLNRDIESGLPSKMGYS